MAAAVIIAASFPSPAWSQPDPAGSIFNPAPPTPDDYKRHVALPYRDVLKSAQPDRRGKELIDKSIHYQVALLADPNQALERNKNKKRLLDDLRSRNTSDGARQYAYGQIILRCQQLFNETDAGVRVTAALLLGDLNISFNPDIPYVPAADALLKTLAFPDDQYIQVKIVAAPALGRILKDARPSDLPVLKRIEIAEKIAAEITRLRETRGQPGSAPALGHQWAMWNLVAALGNCDRVYNSTRQPLFADTLLNVMLDRGEDWLARARAAEALSRLPYESDADLGVLNFETARLLHDMAQQYNTSLAANQVWPMWRRAALHVYFAYEARTQTDRDLNIGLMYEVNRNGLAKFKAKIQETRGLAMPIINTFTANPKVPKPIPAADIDALGAWLNGNAPPPNSKLLPESRVTVPQPAPVTPPATNQASGG